MEPANLNSPSPANDDAQLTALLRGATPPLRDDGFSARVLAALPPPAPAPRAAPRLVLCLIGAAVGGSLAAWRGLAWPELKSNLSEAAAAMTPASQVFANPMLVVALVVTLLSLLYVFRFEVSDRLTR